jgi:hypothetical protein
LVGLGLTLVTIVFALLTSRPTPGQGADATDDIVDIGIIGVPTGVTNFAPVKTPGTNGAPYTPPQPTPTTWSFAYTTKIYLPPGTTINLLVRTQAYQIKLIYRSAL